MSTSRARVAGYRALHAQTDLEVAIKYAIDKQLKHGDLQQEVEALRTAIENLISHVE